MSTPPENIVEVRGLRTSFGRVRIHDGVDLDLHRGEILGVVGGSGTGKSVLLRTIIMLNRADDGSIKMFDREVIGISASRADRLRRRFGVMFQHGALFTSYSLLDNVSVPLREHTNLPDRLIEEVARMKISLCGLSQDAAHKFPGELSGGMLKRAAVARALALDPELLFLDEPSSGLDPVSAAKLDELILQLSESLGLTVFMVTHDLDSLWRITSQVAFLGQKRILQTGSMTELSEAEHPMIQKYFQGPRGRVAKERV
jgi:phospholipid/cholesterol/gamma-HCH transport system ATP-binding protein